MTSMTSIPSKASVALLGIGLALGLGGCGYRLVPVEPRSIGGVYTVDPQIQWSAIEEDNAEVWTVHGRGLETVRFVVALEAGEGILEPDMFSDEEYPTFQADMSPTEIAEFCVDTLTRVGAKRPRSSGLRPAAFGPHPGFRFELAFLSTAGLEMSGMAAGAVVDEKLHLIVLTAPRVHYFDAVAPHVDAMIGSVRFE